MEMPALQRLAPPAVTSLVAFLAFSSQWLFCYVEPGPLRKGDAYIFNGLVASLLIAYWRTCYTDPGRIPHNWHETIYEKEDALAAQRLRWCRKCEAYKPPRAHHCKVCKRCVVKMDHHCVWTANCVSHITLPHFVRFLCYAVLSVAYLEYFVYIRCAILWSSRNLPSYLGPNTLQLSHLFLLTCINSLVLFALVLLLLRVIWSLTLNQTTIEGWEIERHSTLLRRARVLGGYLEGPDGKRVRLDAQEFPWDVGFFTNLSQAMGSRNPLFWPWPLAQSPDVRSGLVFEHNGIDDPSKPWPPPDPDRWLRIPREQLDGDPFTASLDPAAFRERQRADRARYADADGDYVVRRRPFHERLEDMQNAGGEGKVMEVESDVVDEDLMSSEEEDADVGKQAGRKRGGDDDSGEEGWRNREGERLADFGVDEVADFYDEEDDVPLGELLRRRKEHAR